MSQDFYDNSGRIWTPSDADQITTPVQFKFGTQSFRPSYPGDISTPAHADFATGTGNLTWETWIRWAAFDYFYMSQEVNGENLTEWYIGQNGKIEFASWRTGYNEYISISLDPWASFNLNTWYHVAVEKIGDDGWIFVDGVPQTQDNYFDANANITYLNTAVKLYYPDANSVYVDETRFSNVARYPTGGFTPAVAPFTMDANTKVLLHFEPYTPQPTTLGQVIMWKRKGV